MSPLKLRTRWTEKSPNSLERAVDHNKAKRGRAGHVESTIAMTPAELAASFYADGARGSFRDDLEAHLLNGYVFSTPEFFVMGRPVERAAPEIFILDPWHVFRPADCDAWLIYLAAGDWRKAMAMLPYPLHWIGWERGGRGRGLRWYSLDGFESALDRGIA